jgi:peptide-methionine (S)-S-oxide reductase
MNVRATHRWYITVALVGAIAACASVPGKTTADPAPARGEARVVFAGGCFWGMQAVFESLKGVNRAVAGYSGGAKQTAHYELVSTGTTGHAESVEVTYDPKAISFQQLLDVYFLVAHDPTELDRQGPDDGTQYRSEVYYTTEAQHEAALAEIKRLGAEKRFPQPIVTRVAPLNGFYPAEDYHQHYVRYHADEPYVAYNDVPKLEHLRQQYPDLVKATPAP